MPSTELFVNEMADVTRCNFWRKQCFTKLQTHEGLWILDGRFSVGRSCSVTSGDPFAWNWVEMSLFLGGGAQEVAAMMQGNSSQPYVFNSTPRALYCNIKMEKKSTWYGKCLLFKWLFYFFYITMFTIHLRYFLIIATDSMISKTSFLIQFFYCTYEYVCIFWQWKKTVRKTVKKKTENKKHNWKINIL